LGKQVVVGALRVRVEAVLGRGGWSTIYRAAGDDGRLYALKHLALAGDAEHIGHVQREAKTLARVSYQQSI
jgi:AP2-associated kinase